MSDRVLALLGGPDQSEELEARIEVEAEAAEEGAEESERVARRIAQLACGVSSALGSVSGRTDSNVRQWPSCTHRPGPEPSSASSTTDWSSTPAVPGASGSNSEGSSAGCWSIATWRSDRPDGA